MVYTSVKEILATEEIAGLDRLISVHEHSFISMWGRITIYHNRITPTRIMGEVIQNKDNKVMSRLSDKTEAGNYLISPYTLHENIKFSDVAEKITKDLLTKMNNGTL